ncbi:coenzyme A transporter [Sporothrix epigloea]|uniref:leucine--tRNA ligase n=1 Tax=Sporothrix epigloea TaxID=1892477 RepID=A0ABP0DYH5_9PEZI
MIPNGRFLSRHEPAWAEQCLRQLGLRTTGASCSPTGPGLGLSFVVRHTPAASFCRYVSRRAYTDASKPRYRHQKLDLLALDKKWQAKWASAGPGAREPPQSSSSSARPFKYVLPMFPYPSGNLHLGHLRVYSIADVVARFYRLHGHDVLLPMGWDSFGLPAENAAIARGILPAKWTRENIARMRTQLDCMNGSWDWSRQLSTCEPDFYKHTQRIFLTLHRRGLAYQAEAEVNYDPVDQTVLANEQVDAQGRSWRSGALVEKKLLKQWFLRISAYREALLQDLDTLAVDNAWPERVLAMQRNWLGKSTGALVKFPLLAFGHAVTPPAHIEVYTTRIDTLFGVQYVALAASHSLVQDLAKVDPELRAFLDTLPALPPDSKVGYLLPHVRAISPLAYHDSTPEASKLSLPVYVAPYVLGDYGEGAVMGVPGHDVRDHLFWKQHHGDDPVRFVLSASADEATTVLDVDKDQEMDSGQLQEGPFVGHGYMTQHSGPFKGRPSKEAAAMLLSMLESAGLAKATERWRLRDWLISRQRYWGTPIPIIHCESCGAVPVPEADLPVMLPEVEEHFASKQAGNPLASPEAADWANVPCPQCHGPGMRDTDTMDTFVDSSWYYMRFIDPHNQEAPFAADKALQNLPVDLYIGGIEHAILHLLYARFIYKALMTSDLVGTETKVSADACQDSDSVSRSPVYEPFTRLITQGMVHGKTLVDPETGKYLLPNEVDVTKDPARPVMRTTGQPAIVSYEKMSKSKYNGVDPTETIARYGADATRAHMLFQAPVADVLQWDEDKITGVTRWLSRVHELVVALPAAKASSDQTVALDLKARQTSSSTAGELARWDADAAIWRQVQTTIASTTASYTRIYTLNTVVSDLMSLSNTLAAAQEANIATPSVLRAGVSALVRMLAPIAPAFAEECWSILDASAPGLFTTSTPGALFPEEDGSVTWLQPRLQSCAVQVNGKLRLAVDIPLAPSHLKGDELRAWLCDAILATEEGQTRLTGGEGRPDIRQAKKTIVVRDGKLINFVF